MVSWSSGSRAGCGELRLFAVAVAEVSVPAGFVGGDPRAALCPVAVDADGVAVAGVQQVLDAREQGLTHVDAYCAEGPFAEVHGEWEASLASAPVSMAAQARFVRGFLRPVYTSRQRFHSSGPESGGVPVSELPRALVENVGKWRHFLGARLVVGARTISTYMRLLAMVEDPAVPESVRERLLVELNAADNPRSVSGPAKRAEAIVAEFRGTVDPERARQVSRVIEAISRAESAITAVEQTVLVDAIRADPVDVQDWHATVRAAYRLLAKVDQVAESVRASQLVSA